MVDDTLLPSRILIVDDQEANVRLLTDLLEQVGYSDLRSTTDSRQALPLTLAFQPDLILLDLLMPHLDGYAVLELLRTAVAPDDYLPVLVLTADVTAEAKHQALSLGAKDFVTKPIDAMEVLLRIRNLLHTRKLHRQLHHQNLLLEDRVRERTYALEVAQEEILARNLELEATQREILERLGHAAEYRDDETGQHIQRVQRTATLLAWALEIPSGEIEVIQQASPLHDVGKIGIPDAILLKPGKFTPDEWAQMQTHTSIGARILSGGRHRLLQVAEAIALTHHERWDGTGYPHGLQGEAIPLGGRIVAVADVFDALTSDRPYKRRWAVEEAVAEIERQSGLQFDPAIVAVFLRLHRDGVLAG